MFEEFKVKAARKDNGEYVEGFLVPRTKWNKLEWWVVESMSASSINGHEIIPDSVTMVNCNGEHCVTIGELANWYQDSLLDSTIEPVWTDKHIEELFSDFFLIPRRKDF